MLVSIPDTAPDILATPGLAEFMHNQQRLGVLQIGSSCCALWKRANVFCASGVGFVFAWTLQVKLKTAVTVVEKRKYLDRSLAGVSSLFFLSGPFLPLAPRPPKGN